MAAKRRQCLPAGHCPPDLHVCCPLGAAQGHVGGPASGGSGCSARTSDFAGRRNRSALSPAAGREPSHCAVAFLVASHAFTVCSRAAGGRSRLKFPAHRICLPRGSLERYATPISCRPRDTGAATKHPIVCADSHFWHSLAAASPACSPAGCHSNPSLRVARGSYRADSEAVREFGSPLLIGTPARTG